MVGGDAEAARPQQTPNPGKQARGRAPTLPSGRPSPAQPSPAQPQPHLKGASGVSSRWHQVAITMVPPGLSTRTWEARAHK